MGAASTKRWLCLRPRTVKVIVQGLNGSGKSSLIHLLKYNETLVRSNDVTAPINIANVETIEHQYANLVCWDIPNGEKMKSQYYEDSDAVIYVVDGCDSDRLDTVRNELQTVLSDEFLLHVPVLILANKQDLSYALSATQLKERLAFNGYTTNRDIQIKPTSTLSGAGLGSAIDWLVEAILRTQQTTKDSPKDDSYTAVVPNDNCRVEMVTGLPGVAMTTSTEIGAPPQSYENSKTNGKLAS